MQLLFSHLRWPTYRLALLAIGCCCALALCSASEAWGQNPIRKVGSSGTANAPTNPLRSSSESIALTRIDPNVKPTQAQETLPTPLRLSPMGAAPMETQPQQPPGVPIPGSQPEQYIEGDPNQAWPADAPAMDHYGGGRFGNHHGQAYPAREPWFSHNDPNDAGRHTGWGDPLTGTSWLNRPWYVGVFVGGMIADDILEDHVYSDSGPIVGLRLGHDFDHFWGWEARYAYSRVETFNVAGTPISDPAREYYVDLALLHYPWGDSRWRPYLLAGLGFMNARYMNEAGQGIDDTVLTMPLGVGLKMYQSPWFTIRFDATANLSFSGAHVDPMNNFSLMMGVEYRFGGKRPSYFPWTGNTSYW
ncbi:porin family protein [Anatilimnocola floriformis]|uniref:porin family protein n=1 Tax=Anatilimnocola floriformis TaxID=2948575 RepID=UPI0020C577A0|nr:outer membrane beta-barrel protein [Anatilimnocola floriformis]